MRKFLAVALLALATPAGAADVVSYASDESFDDATFALESAIIGRGLVVDYVSHVGEMLARTKEDVGGTKDIFDAADIYLFCSAAVSRQVMEADAMNVIHCPYRIFVVDQGGEVKIGFGALHDESMRPVQDMLDSIAREAAGQ